MKKLLLALILGLVFLPLPATAQKWVDPYTRSDGSYFEGHWENPKDSWQRSYSQPGTTNPMTGQFNPYGRRDYPAPANPPPVVRSPYGIPGSSAPNPYAIPGSSDLSRYAIPGSSPKMKVVVPNKAQGLDEIGR
jgi:hypothetical protein